MSIDDILSVLATDPRGVATFLLKFIEAKSADWRPFKERMESRSRLSLPTDDRELPVRPVIDVKDVVEDRCELTDECDVRRLTSRNFLAIADATRFSLRLRVFSFMYSSLVGAIL